MNRISFLSATATATAMLLIHVPAHATVSSSGSLTNLTFSLYDLNTTDGVTPWIRFAGNSYTFAQVLHNHTYEPNTPSSFGGGPFDASSSVASASQMSASATSTGSTPPIVSGTGATVVGGLQASGSANGFSVTQDGYDYSYKAVAQWGNSFTVSANTLLLVSADAEASVAKTHGWYTQLPAMFESADGYVHIGFRGPGISGNGSQDSTDSLTLGIGYLSAAATSDASRTLEASFMNRSNGDMTGSFEVTVGSSGFSNVGSLPEPEAYAMLLAGLGVLGFMRRRRKAD